MPSSSGFRLDQIVRKTIVFCDEKRPEYVGIEAEQFQELLVHEFRRQCDGHGLRWPLYRMHDRRGGQAWPASGGLSQYVINRELRFKADSPGCRLLVDQLMDFPLGEHDDGPDALEMCVRLAVGGQSARGDAGVLRRQSLAPLAGGEWVSGAAASYFFFGQSPRSTHSARCSGIP